MKNPNSCSGDEESRLEIQSTQETNESREMNEAVSSKGEPQDDNSTGMPQDSVERPQRPSFHRMTSLQRMTTFIVRKTHERPRLSAIIFEVILPLLSLILISMLFGYFLARLEAPAEMEKNNLILASREALVVATILERVIMRDGPLLCVELYFEERAGILVNTSVEDHFVNELDEIHAMLYEKVGSEGMLNYIAQSQDLTSANSTTKDIMGTLSKYDLSNIDDIPGFLQSIADCGEQIDKVMNHSSVATAIAKQSMYGISKSEVSFQWIKCPKSLVTDPDMEDAMVDLWKVFAETFKVSGAGVQQEAVMNRWREDYSQLFDEYYSSYKESGNMTRLDAREKAITKALLEADGFDGCIKDTMSAAWFWFVVMTTIGYGNASPSTFGGRALVFTFGFLNILLFGAVLARAGDIVTTLFCDTISRKKRLKWLSERLWAEAIFWCMCTFLWFLVIAAVFVWWKKDRVNQEESFSNAYWFAFISITTVGFGDLYLEHEQIAPHDVIGFAMLFIVGFVLFANFLTCLTKLLRNIGTFIPLLRK